MHQGAEPIETMEPMEPLTLMEPMQVMETMEPMSMAIEPEMAIDPVDSGDTQRVTKPDGTVQEISTTEDGVETQKTTLPDGTTVETRADGVKIQVNANGTSIETHPDGYRKQIGTDKVSIERFPDGRTVQMNPTKGTSIEKFPDGSKRNIFANGAVVEYDAEGVKTQTNPNGNVTVTRLDGSKLQTNPDGTVIEKLVDGTQVQRAWPKDQKVEYVVDDSEVAKLNQGSAPLKSAMKGGTSSQPPAAAMGAMQLGAEGEGASSAASTPAVEEEIKVIPVIDTASFNLGPNHNNTVSSADLEASLLQSTSGMAEPEIIPVMAPIRMQQPVDPQHQQDEQNRPTKYPNQDGQLSMLGGFSHPETTKMEQTKGEKMFRPDEVLEGVPAQSVMGSSSGDGVQSMVKTGDGGAETTFTDGVKVKEFGDGTVVQDYPDGTKIIMNNRVKRTMKTNGYTIDRYNDGRTVENHPDGTVIEVMPDGTRIQENPNGTKEKIDTDGTKTQVLDDGTVKVTKGQVITKDFTQFPGAYNRAVGEQGRKMDGAFD